MKIYLKILYVIVASVFAALVLVTFLSPKASNHSSELLINKTETEHLTRTDYVNATGELTFATDKGYATKIVHKEDGKTILEEFLDETGAAVMIPAGYSSILHEYENGKNTRIIYLDTLGNPVVINNGYDTIHRTYNEAGKADTDTYYANGVQVELKQGYWQYKRLYQNKKLSEVWHLDQKGELVNNSIGYAILRRSYIDNGQEDMYFGENRKPAASTLGQYGVRTETIDNTKITTYLNADGNPMNTNRGYAVIVKNGNKTLYYDVEGNPATAGHSQYGIEIRNGKSIYLDENGEEMHRLDIYLHSHPLIVMIFGIVLTVVAVMLKGRWRTAFALVYVLFILYMTMVYREPSNPRGSFILFDSYKRFLSSASTRQDILNNIWLFVPLGVCLYSPEHRFRWLWYVALSIVIETVQYFGGIGYCEFDDVFNNSLGGLIGYGIGMMGYRGDKASNVATIDE